MKLVATTSATRLTTTTVSNLNLAMTTTDTQLRTHPTNALTAHVRGTYSQTISRIYLRPRFHKLVKLDLTFGYFGFWVNLWISLVKQFRFVFWPTSTNRFGPLPIQANFKYFALVAFGEDTFMETVQTEMFLVFFIFFVSAYGF